MNIKNAIIRGRYPVDDKGRALVPVESGLRPGKIAWTATICAIDGPKGLIGFGPASAREWSVLGAPVFHDDGRLMPPLRKSKARPTSTRVLLSGARPRPYKS